MGMLAWCDAMADGTFVTARSSSVLIRLSTRDESFRVGEKCWLVIDVNRMMFVALPNVFSSTAM